MASSGWRYCIAHVHTCPSVFALLSLDSSGAMVAVFLESVRIVAIVAFLDSAKLTEIIV